MPLTDIDGQRLGDSVADKLGNRNLIINGAMQVAQRGTGNFAIGDDDYPVDRFLFSDGGSGFTGGANGTQSTTAPTDFKNSLEIDITTADTALTADSQGKIEYRIEGQDVAHLNWGTSNAQTVTVSFYIKSNKTGETAVALVNNANDRSYVAAFNINTADTWERKELTVAGPTDGTWLDTNGIGIRLRWGSFGSDFQTTSTNQWLSSQKMTTTSSINFFDSVDNDLFLTGVQLEVGNTATPFEHKRFDQELTDCCRYYQKSYQYGTAIGTAEDNGAICNRSAQNTAMSQHMGFEFRHRFRANPTVTIYSPNNGTASQVSNRGSAPTTHNSNVSVGSLFNIGQTAVSAIEMSTSTGPAILFHYEADAEL